MGRKKQKKTNDIPKSNKTTTQIPVEVHKMSSGQQGIDTHANKVTKTYGNESQIKCKNK